MTPPGTTIVITRRVRPGAVDSFEDSVRAWIPRALSFPGHAGVLVVRPAGEGDEYGVVLRFREEQDWAAFQRWPEYTAFLERIRPMLLTDPNVRVSAGLEAWIDAGSAGRPVRWRMALVTFVAVNVLVYAAMQAVRLIGPNWPFWPAFILTNALVVAGLAWVVMPLLTRWLHGWLIGGRA
jgi:hypothetical protein